VLLGAGDCDEARGDRGDHGDVDADEEMKGRRLAVETVEAKLARSAPEEKAN
jgi:hypothetical protein